LYNYSKTSIHISLKGDLIKSILFKNFLSLATLQLINYIFPLITFPYLVRVLGPEKFGLINFAAAFISFFSIITNYGFNLSAMREISINKSDAVQLRTIFSSVMVIKICISIVSFGILLAIIHTFSGFNRNAPLLIISFGVVFGNVLFPYWFFSGLEKMNYIMFLNTGMKCINVLLIFYLIKLPSDFILLSIINSLSYILLGIVSQFILRYKFEIIFCFPDLTEIRWQLREGFHLFISSISITIYTTSTLFFLGLFTNNTIVGFYSAADKIRIAFQAIFSTISQTLFPFAANVITGTSKVNVITLYHMFGIIIFSGLLVSVMLFFLADPVIITILGRDYITSAKILKMNAWIIVIVTISNVLGIQVLINIGLKVIFSKIIITSTILYLVLACFFIPKYHELGSSFTVILTESAVALMMIGYFLVNKNKMNHYKYV